MYNRGYIPMYQGGRYGLIGRVGRIGTSEAEQMAMVAAGGGYEGSPVGYAGPVGPYGYPQGVQFAPPVMGGLTQAVPPNASEFGMDVFGGGTACAKARVLSLNFANKTGIAAGATQTLVQRPQMAFRPTKLTCPSFIADNFLLLSLQIGVNPQNVGNGGEGQSMQTITEAAQDMLYVFDVAQVGIDISVTVENISSETSKFFFTMTGTAVQTQQL
jgi:hypothetical protein